jgi:LAGLIDADG-like domain
MKQRRIGTYTLGARGPRPTGSIPKWSAELAYVVGLMASDGCLGTARGYINFTSKDRELVATVKRVLKRSNPITVKKNQWGQPALYIQWRDVVLHEWFISIGITPKKSKTIGEVLVPDRYIMHFVRGVWDGDGTVYSYVDPRWGTHMFYVAFASASPRFIDWLRSVLLENVGVSGHITAASGHSC